MKTVKWGRFYVYVKINQQKHRQKMAGGNFCWKYGFSKFELLKSLNFDMKIQKFEKISRFCRPRINDFFEKISKLKRNWAEKLWNDQQITGILEKNWFRHHSQS